ncbi:MAG: cobalt-precorrin-6A reductase [Magnetovibrio sp.]|nr:cobalt-precorrin-6A reductase [Magnetovibrio sp.]
MPGEPKRVLILGGTAEARQLAERAVTGLPTSVEVITSFAGRTNRPRNPPGMVREGGFGGAHGMADYLKDEAITLVVDATHPFAEAISDHAHDACVMAEVRRVMLRRPAWRLPPRARWVEVPDMEAAADAVSRFARRAFLTVGRQELAAFAGVDGVWFLVRMIEAPEDALPLADHEVVLGRPPFDLAAERALIETHNIDTLVSKHSGGPLPAKVEAAAEAGLPIVLVQPPPPPPGTEVATAEAALDWIISQL